MFASPGDNGLHPASPGQAQPYSAGAAGVTGAGRCRTQSVRFGRHEESPASAKRPRRLARIGLAVVGTAVLAALGVVVATQLGWQWCLVVMAALAVAGLLVSIGTARRRRRRRRAANADRNRTADGELDAPPLPVVEDAAVRANESELLRLVAAADALPRRPPGSDDASLTLDVTVHRRGNPIAGAVVTLTDRSGAQIDGHSTDAEGACLLQCPAAGDYVLIISKPGCRPQVMTLQLEEGDEASVAVTVELAGECSLAGSITGTTGGAVAGATVTLTDAGGAVVASCRSDAAGRYALHGLVASDCTLAITADGYRPAAARVRLIGPGEWHHDIELAGTNRLSGIVSTGDGEHRLPGIRVSLFDESGSEAAVTLTDGSGTYCFEGLPAGSYTLRASAPPPTERQIELLDQTTEVDLPLNLPD